MHVAWCSVVARRIQPLSLTRRLLTDWVGSIDRLYDLRAQLLLPILLDVVVALWLALGKVVSGISLFPVQRCHSVVRPQDACTSIEDTAYYLKPIPVVRVRAGKDK